MIGTGGSWDRRALGWAALGGIAAAIATGIPMHLMGMLAMGPAALVGSDNVWVGWLVHIAAGIVFGTLYGFFGRTTRFGKAALTGALYGLFVGVLFAWLALFSILDMPLWSQMGAIDVLLHVGWGIVVGLVTAWGLRTATGTAGARRRATGLAR